MSNASVCHKWASYNLDASSKAKAQGKSGNIFYDGDTIYSYGRHFPMARVIKTKKGKAVLFTTRTYSSSTSNHCSKAKGAIYGRSSVPAFHVERPEEDPTNIRNRDNFLARIKAGFEAAARARSSAQWRLNSAKETLKDAQAFAKFFGLKWKFEGPKDLATLAKHCKAQAAKKAAQTIAANKAKAQALAEFEKAWKAGQDVPRPAGFGYFFSPDWARVKPSDPKTVETNRGAEVPKADAIKLCKLALAVKAKAEPFEPSEPVNVGPFQLNRIDAEGRIKVGCHTFEPIEVLRFASVLGVA